MRQWMEHGDLAAEPLNSNAVWALIENESNMTEQKPIHLNFSRTAVQPCSIRSANGHSKTDDVDQPTFRYLRRSQAPTKFGSHKIAFGF